MDDTTFLIPVDMDREEVGHLFENYNLNSACVVDKNNKLVGMITSDDVLTVLKEEAEEDALRLAGGGRCGCKDLSVATIAIFSSTFNSIKSLRTCN